MEKSKEFKVKSKEHFNNIAVEYNNSGDGKFVNVMYEEIVSRVEKLQGEKVLEVGCGNGNILKMLEEIGDYKLFGLDLSENMIREAKKQLSDKVELKVGDAEELPWKDNKFDIIICNASFHHYPNALKVLSEMKRTLKEDGTIIVGDPTAPPVLRNILNFFIRFSNNGDYRIYNKSEIDNLFNEAGFKSCDWKMINNKTIFVNGVVQRK